MEAARYNEFWYLSFAVGPAIMLLSVLPGRKWLVLAAANLSWLRRFAVGLLKRHPGKESIKCKMKMAGWSNDFLTEVLVRQGT